MTALSNAIGQALVGLAEDPLLVWNYTLAGILAFLGGIGFWATNYKLDREEDHLNDLADSEFLGRENKTDAEQVAEK